MSHRWYGPMATPRHRSAGRRALLDRYEAWCAAHGYTLATVAAVWWGLVVAAALVLLHAA